MSRNPVFPIPRVKQLWFSDERKEFKSAVERYREWVVLGLRSGSFRFALGTDAGEICRPGEFVVCPPGADLHREALEPVVFYYISFQWKPGLPALWRGRMTPRDPVRYGSTLEHLQRQAGIFDAGHPTAWGDHLLADLLYLCLDDARPAGREKIPDRLMLKAEEWICGHLEEDSTLEELAAHLRLTPFQLSRRFRSAWGLNPAAYRTRLRMDKARRLLRETDWTMERVAEACGFGNAFYFSRVFRSQTGEPPRVFRHSRRV